MDYKLEILHKSKIDYSLVADLISEEWPKNKSLRYSKNVYPKNRQSLFIYL